MSHHVNPEAFGEWPLEAQLAYLDSALVAETLPELWRLCAPSMDSKPIIHLAALAVERDLEVPGDWLLDLRPAVLSSVLALEGLSRSVKQAWLRSDLSHLVSFCLLDRYLRRHATSDWESLVVAVGEEASRLLKRGQSPPCGLLMRLQGSQQKELAVDPELWRSWDGAWKEAARTAIKSLAERPRDVSQANAERLLSQQVYTDPGHFLLELLQNADDAGASEFSVEFGADSLLVTHDGEPFDFRDLVGVLSIGQTTKKSTQIGYFGVGFKSVYEVTDRPRIQSGHFSFEIADISVPRSLSGGWEGGQTTLTLPLKPGLSPEIYWRKALAIEPALLLNLPHLRRLQWSRPGQAPVQVSLSPAEGEVMVLRHQERESRFLLWSGEYQHQGARPPGKPARAGVHIALPLDGRPPTTSLYSFLPIAESSGLRFIVGSHFDVPVDRERLDVVSLWNRGVIASIPQIVAHHLAREPARGWDLLPLMPLPEDPLAPLFQGLPAELAAVLSELPLVPGGRCARDVRLLASGLEDLFDLSSEPTILAPAEPRTRRWLELLGASPYRVEELLAELSSGVVPGRLASADVFLWSRLHAVLMGHEESALRDVPIFVDEQGAPLAPSAAMILSSDWQPLFAQPPRAVAAELAVLPDSAALLARLAVPVFDWSDLVRELTTHGTARLHGEAVFERLQEAPRAIILACLELPLFTDQHGVPGRLVPPEARHLGIVAAAAGVPVQLLPEARLLQSSPALERLLETLRWPRLDLPALVEALEWHCLRPGQADLLLESILAGDVAWTGPQLSRLAALSIFETAGAGRLPLTELWHYQDPVLAELLPDCPGLAPNTPSERVVERLGQNYRLRRADLDTLLAQLPGARPADAVAFLAKRSQSLTRVQIEHLFGLPLFDGRPLRWPDQPDGRGLLAARPEYSEIFRDLGLAVLSCPTTETVLPLLKAGAYPLLGLTQLVDRLQASAPPAELLPRLRDAMQAESAGLQLAFSKEVRQALRLWLACDGSVVSMLDVPPSMDLAILTGQEGKLLAEPLPSALHETFPLLDGDAYLRRRISCQAKIGEPLAQQPAWCDAVEKVDRVASYLPLGFFMVDAESRLRDTSLHTACPLCYPWLVRSPLAGELIHLESSDEQKRDCVPLEGALILETYFPLRLEPAMRQAFYAYLQTELGTLASQRQAREMLLELPLWRSAGGRWKSLDELILDPDIPDLGSDWNPHPEIPTALLNALETVLGVGRPDPLTLLGDHLLPAYLERPSARASILGVMARLSRGVENARLRRLLRGTDGNGSFPLPDGGDLRTAYHPPEELAGLASLPTTSSDNLVFLRRLGLAYLPPDAALRAAGNRLEYHDGEALLRLVEWSWQQQPEELEKLWETLEQLVWLPARDRTLKLPRLLFLRTAEMEELIGFSPELFVSRRLPVGLARRLGLKDEKELDPLLVVRHLRGQVQRGERAAPALYAFLEVSLREQRLNPGYLVEQLREVPWVWTDEGEYRLARHVLAVPAFRYFGPFRGTWEGVHQRYPQLAALFAISNAVTPQMVLEFLREVHQSPGTDVTRRLLRSCLALLGDSDLTPPREWKILPANLASTDHPLVVAAAETGLVRSNSPTLVALFASAGRLLVLDPGDSESAPSLAKLYQRLNIPRLRDAYTVRPDRSSREVTAEMGDAVAHFRGLLRGLAGVLPRLRAARPHLEQEGEWLAQTRLEHFMTAGPIRVLEDLRLTYDLPAVARVAVEAAAAFDPERGELLVSAPALAHPAGHAVALAEGLLEIIYQGPGAEGLVDLLNLLLPMGGRQEMDAYLDRRHFPRPGGSERAGHRLKERLGEILDYGLHKILARRFEELSRVDWSRWRSPDLELSEAAAPATRELLALLGLTAPSLELSEMLTDMLEAPTLEALASQLWESGVAPAVATSGAGAVPSTGGVVPLPVGAGPPPSAVAARRPPVAAAQGGLAALGQKMLGRLGQMLGLPTTAPEAMGFQRQLPNVAETYRNPPEKHLLVSTRALKGHDLYCVARLGVDFDARRQVYLPGPVPWVEPFRPSGKTVEFSGRLTLPDYVLPRPLFSKLVGPPLLKGSQATLRGPDELGAYRLQADDPAAAMSYTVELSLPPELDVPYALPEVDPRFLRPTTPLQALPSVVLEWVSWARSSGLPSWQLAERARDFVTAHYRYDQAYMDSEEIQALAGQPYRSDENRMLSLLHAGARAGSLGTGVCLELSAILVEILRRARIPAVLASVWMLDEGLIHHPDHAVALVFLPTPDGPVWFPFEPSQNRMVSGQAETELTRAQLLQSAADLVLGPSFSAPPEPELRERAQEEALLRTLGDSRRLAALLECLAKTNRYLRDIDDELRWLAAKGYLSVEKEELYRVSPRPRRSG